MASITSSLFTQDLIHMMMSSEIVFGSQLTATDTEFSWISENFFNNLVRIEGTGFTYTGSGDARELNGGTITRISIDVNGDNGSGVPGDVVITMLDGINPAAIAKGDAQGFWGEILKGADTFNLVNFSAADIGRETGSFFGDDFSSPNTALNNIDAGADDTILGADNNLVLIGDVVTVRGGADGDLLITSEYTGGDDTIVGVRSKFFVDIYGDASGIGSDGILNGGEDVLNNGRNRFAGTGMVCGDAKEMYEFAVLNGGNDEITAGRNGLGFGDVYAVKGSSSFITGGDDVIRGGGVLFSAGDAGFVASDAQSVTITGGNDRIIGAEQDDTISGDLFEAQTGASLSLAGGDDVLLGGGGDDQIYGEIAFGSSKGISGGDDTLRGEAGEDRLYGQTGNDLLQGGGDFDILIGGRGDDRLSGGDGNDTFAFDRGSGNDRILDFADAAGVGQDTIDLSAYGFAGPGDIGRQTAGDDLILLLGGQNQIRIANYLAGHAAGDINDDFIL